MRLAQNDRVAYGDAILERIADGGVPTSVKIDHAAFKKEHTTFVAASKSVAAAEKVHEKAVAAVGVLDVKRDTTVLELADKMPSVGLGTRTSPFAKFSRYAPSRLIGLPYAAETEELRTVIAAITEAKPPAEIAKLCARVLTENDAVAAALQALTIPASALNEARAKRDAGLPDWDKSLRHLKDSAAVAFRDSAGRYDTVFADPEAVQTNIRPKRRKAKGDPKPILTSGEVGATTPAPKAKAKRRARRR